MLASWNIDSLVVFEDTDSNLRTHSVEHNSALLVRSLDESLSKAVDHFLILGLVVVGANPGNVHTSVKHLNELLSFFAGFTMRDYLSGHLPKSANNFGFAVICVGRFNNLIKSYSLALFFFH